MYMSELIVSIPKKIMTLLNILLAVLVGGAVHSSFVSLVCITNNGATWGLLEGNRTLLLIVSMVLLGAMYLIDLGKGRIGELGKAMFIGGAVVNFVERLMRGHVCDYIDLRWSGLSIMNIPDIMIFIGGAIVILSLFINDKEE